MKVLFPRYDDFKPHWLNQTYEREVNEDNYFKTLDDFKAYIERTNPKITIEICEDIKSQILTAIQTNKGIKFLIDDLIEFRKSNNPLISSYPLGEVRDYWKTQNDLLIQAYKTLMAKNNKFILENKDAVFIFLDEKRNSTIEKLKEKRKEANKKYYEKVKATLKIDKVSQVKSILTEEEKKQKKNN